jgi:alkylation response protein AidB-like acyl-CoA dehydrogenase
LPWLDDNGICVKWKWGYPAAVDFELDEDQAALQDAAAEVLTKECPPSLLRAVIDGGDGDEELWQTLVALEWPGIALPESVGGSGATEVELAIVLEQLGHVADPTPFLATTTQFAPVVLESTDDEQHRRFLGSIATGGRGTLALAGDTGAWDPSTPAVRAERTDGGWRLDGRASYVLDADRVDEIAVVAATTDGPIVAVAPAADLTVTREPALDPTMHVCTVDTSGVTVADDRVLALDDPTATVARTLDAAITGLALVAVGACQQAFEMAVAYSKERHQFDVPIGSFQALKHKAVDMHVAIERARAVAYFSALCAAEGDDRRPLAAAMAKAAAGDAQRIVFRTAVQFFGGIGFTWENDLHLYLRRAKATELLFGGAAHHRAVVGRAVLAQQLATTSATTRTGS